MKITKMKIAGIILTSVYIVFMLLALFSSGTMGIAGIFIILGSILSLLYMLLLRRKNYSFLLIGGMVCISVSAIIIGVQQDSTQISHHLIRTAFEGGIIFLFLK